MMSVLLVAVMGDCMESEGKIRWDLRIGVNACRSIRCGRPGVTLFNATIRGSALAFLQDHSVSSCCSVPCFVLRMPVSAAPIQFPSYRILSKPRFVRYQCIFLAGKQQAEHFSASIVGWASEQNPLICIQADSGIWSMFPYLKLFPV
jgi:hypothetical protein